MNRREFLLAATAVVVLRKLPTSAARAEASTYLMPTGTIIPYMGDKIPKGWLLCDGSYITSHKLRKVVGSKTPDLRHQRTKVIHPENYGLTYLPVNYLIKK